MAASTAMVAGSVVTVPLSAATKLSSSSVFGSAQVQFAPIRNVNLSSSRVVAVNASFSEDSQTVKRQVLNSIIATGIAISLSSSALAASGPGGDGATRTARKADELLQGADALIKNDSPERFGPDRGMGTAAPEDIARFSQKAGSGARPGLQEATSAQVAGARDQVSANLAKTKRRIDGIWGQGKGLAGEVIEAAQGKADDASKGAKQLFGQAKTTSNVANTAKTVTAGVKSKADAVTTPAKSGGGFFGKIKQQVKGVQGAVASKAEVVKKALPGQ